MGLHDYDLHCERCGEILTLAESANGGLCGKCLNKAALEDDEKMPTEIPTYAQEHVEYLTEEKVVSRGDILLKAHDLINGERQDQYGKPEDCFGTIAELWNAYLQASTRKQDDGDFYPLTTPLLTAHHVAVMMALLKTARIAHGAGSMDSYVDCAGYIALAADMTENRSA